MTLMQLRAALSLTTLVTAGLAFLAVSAIVVTNPSRLGPVGVTLWFGALWAAVAGMLAILLYVAKSWRKGFSDERPVSKLYASLRQGLLAAGVLTVMLALSSLRQLSLRDAVLLLILAGLIEFYFRTRN